MPVSPPTVRQTRDLLFLIRPPGAHTPALFTALPGSCQSPRLASLQSPDSAGVHRDLASFGAGGREVRISSRSRGGGGAPGWAPLPRGAQAQSLRLWGAPRLALPPGPAVHPEGAPLQGLRAALGKPGASQGAFSRACKFPPHPRAGSQALLPPLKSPPLQLPSGQEQTTDSPGGAGALLQPSRREP